MRNRQLLTTLLLAATSAAIDIPTVPTWSTSDHCTDKSLTIPSWIISNYKVTSFGWNDKLQSRQPGCRCNWIDNRHNIVSFTASGSTTITQCAGTDCVSPITHLVYGTLSLPVPLTSAQPSPPAGYNAPTCASVGESQWAVDSAATISFQNYNKGQFKDWYIEDEICRNGDNGDFIVKGVYLRLNVTNNAISHEVTCSFDPDRGHASLPNPLRCTGGNFNEITLDVTWTGTAPNFDLKVEELWYCLEKPEANVNPSAIVASGSTSLTLLTCESHTGITGSADDIRRQSHILYYRGIYFEANFPATDRNNVSLQQFTAGLTGPGFADFFFYKYKAISGSGVDAILLMHCVTYSDGKPKDQHWFCT
ncbi:hypothetical protein K504DRAFT_506752 [Pleomassaria siparia CBS 279.74]|uniref:Uncharacterized protein n=1 Tax=Pleomassaria siparia CBS 279.74 TaxID=1314801 RepID=A0A6G1JW00_9PLEO|nr:hypothetical protein K504DRAFT_506752 [Pleomassaria siparia CBS 279.74]